MSKSKLSLQYIRKLQLVYKILFGKKHSCKYCGEQSKLAVVFYNQKYHIKYFCSSCYDKCLMIAYHKYILEDQDWRDVVDDQLLSMGKYPVFVDNIQDYIRQEQLL